MKSFQIKNNNKKTTAIDLFCGAGGFSLAALNTEITVKASLEIDSIACETYKHNFHNKLSTDIKIFNEDITKISPAKFMHECCIAPGNIDIMMGGPPCQGFSSHRIKDSGVNDPRNNLLIKYFEYVDALAPRSFIIENVPGLLWKRHTQYVESLYNLAKTSGYDILAPETLNAKDYGVPQNRNRVFILGFKGKKPIGLQWPPKPLNFNPMSDEAINHGFPAWRNASEVFSTPLSTEDPNNIHMNSRPYLVEVFKSTPPNGGNRRDSNRVLPCHKGYNGHMDVYGRIDPSQPGPTMTTACINPSKGRFLHPTEHHGITLRHAARFQTFPDWFVFKGGLMAAGVQIGNAVPIKLGEIVLNTIKTALSPS